MQTSYFLTPKTLFIYLLPLGEVGTNRLLDPLKVHTKEALDIWALVMQGFFQAQEGTQIKCFLSVPVPKCTCSVRVDTDSFYTVIVEEKTLRRQRKNVVI
jgi:hypothetical protein